MFSYKQILMLLGLCFTLILAGTSLAHTDTYAAPPGQEEEKPLRVVTKVVEPFVIKDGERLTGASIDLWKEIALITEAPFEFIEVETVTEQLEAVANGEADIAIAAISMTPEREILIDFSYPYFRSGLQIMTKSQQGKILFAWLSVILSTQFLAAIAVLLITMFLIGHLVWLVERKDNPDFPQTYWRGIWEGLWWSAVTITTVGYGDKTTKHHLGRVLAIFWMFAGIFLIANFTAVVSSQLTVNELKSSISGVEDLPGKRVATVTGTTSASYLKDFGIPFQGVTVIEEAYELLKNDQVDAIVYDAPVLQYYAATAGKGRLIVVGDPFKRETYGIAFPPNSPHEEEINKALLEISRNGTGDEIYRRWYISEDGK